MGLSLSTIDLNSGKDLLSGQLCIESSQPCWSRAVIAEQIRLQIYQSNGVLHTSALTASLRTGLFPFLRALDLDEDDYCEPDELSVELQHLESLGDLFRQPGGVWRGCPLRFLRISPSSEKVIVLGGIPNVAIRDFYGFNVRSYGRARIVDIAAIPTALREDRQYWQSESNWLGMVFDDIASWTKAEMSRATLEYQPGLLEGTQDIQVYLSSRRRGSDSSHRWANLVDVMDEMDQAFLCRAPISGRRFSYKYFIGQVDVRGGGRTAFSSTELAINDARRIRFGIDSINGNSLTVRLEHGVGACKLEIWRPWPNPESRVLSLGQQSRKKTDSSVEHYLFPSVFASLAVGAANQLGLAIRNA